jgi:hypothetical protein
MACRLLLSPAAISEPHDRAQFERFEQIVDRHGGEVLPVFLSCAEEETARRIGNADRVERGKITLMQGLAGFRAAYNLNLVAVPRANCLRLDTSVLPPEATARTIVRHFGLR